MNQAQTQAVERMRSYLVEREVKASKYAKLAAFDVRDDNGFVSVTAKIEASDDVNPNSLLHLLQACTWLAFIGKRGGIQLAMGPKSLRQFKGKRFLFFSVKRSYTNGDF